jgi:hypothetical protein
LNRFHCIRQPLISINIWLIDWLLFNNVNWTVS